MSVFITPQYCSEQHFTANKIGNLIFDLLKFAAFIEYTDFIGNILYTDTSEAKVSAYVFQNMGRGELSIFHS